VVNIDSILIYLIIKVELMTKTMTHPPAAHPLFSLQGKTALISGAGSAEGIGFATARLLGELGCRVALCATGPRIHERAASLREQGIAAQGYTADLTVADEVDRLLVRVTQDFPRIDILVNNAGMAQEGQAESFTSFDMLADSDWSKTIQRNLDTCYLLTRRVLPGMLATGQGRIINVASVTGPVVANPGEVAYSAAKAGMVGMSRALALEVGHKGITVNCVAPGWVATASQTEVEKQAAMHTPIGRAGTPEEMAAVIVFLAMPAASYIHGEMLVVDGANCLQEHKG